jgi:uncharacterized coiled-coil protein SlyX
MNGQMKQAVRIANKRAKELEIELAKAKKEIAALQALLAEQEKPAAPAAPAAPKLSAAAKSPKRRTTKKKAAEAPAPAEVANDSSD